MVVCGSTALGILCAYNARTRLKQLRELERIIGYLSGEIRYRREVLGVACKHVSARCSTVYADWLLEVAASTENENNTALQDIWECAKDKLYASSCLSKRDMDYINNLGQTLGYLDVQAQERGLSLLQQEIHETVQSLEHEVQNRERIAVILGIIGGLLLVIVLV